MAESSNRFAQRMADANVAKDTRLLGDFVAIYCKGNHAQTKRVPLQSEGVTLGAYGRKVPAVCPDCAELLTYAEKRRAFCAKDPKPFCSNCDTHCYEPEMREYMREVMRYAGPRSMFHGHAIDSIKHLLEGRAAKKAATASDPTSD
ncbi:MAG: nitrous oxide-stimulated promoter family protein [Actinomycetota bacterium]|jgi:hypothetical protein|nr:nitrous oxide-stimulated promoter family protein [Actinomycetota bacterium]